MGKIFLYVFLITTILSFSKVGWIDVVASLILLASIVFNGFLHFKYKDLEMDRVMVAIERISASKNESANGNVGS